MKERKTLYLSLKKEWYNLIDDGVKTEEYREIKPYWVKRLLALKNEKIDAANVEDITNNIKELGDIPTDMCVVPYTDVCFSYGYTKKRMTFKIDGISISNGKTEWGAPEQDKVFVIKLGERI